MSEDWREKREQLRAAVEGVSPSDRLRMTADVGAKVRRAFGPPSADVNEFAQKLIQTGIVDPSEFPDMEIFREEIRTLQMATVWANSGFNVFSPSVDLCTGLLLTEPPVTPSEGLHLPYPAFAIRVPPQMIPLFVRDQKMWVDTIWVHQFVSLHSRDRVTPTDFLRYTAQSGFTQLWRDRHPMALDTEDECFFNRVLDGDPPSVPEDDLTLQATLRLVKNLLHWLDATGGLGAHPKPQAPKLKKKASKEARARVESGAWPHVWMFGQQVKVGPELTRMVPEVILGNHREAPHGWKVRVQHIVRGHWKFQPHGEGLRLRKRLWISPYWRGPEGAAAWSHIYSER